MKEAMGKWSKPLVKDLGMMFGGILKRIAVASLFFCVSCGGDDKGEAAFEAKVERTRAVLANQCKVDSDCVITGCHANLCRAMPDDGLCDHRVVVAMDSAEDMEAVRSLVKGMLAVREAETVRMGGYGAGKWTLSFQAPPVQRQRVEDALQNLSLSGFARIHPKSGAHSRALYESLFRTESHADIAQREMRGAGLLVEKQIRSGDVLSKDDIRTAWERVAPSLESVRVSEDDGIERFWAYDVIFGTIAQLRFWPIDRRQRIPARLWQDFESRVDNGDIILTATLPASVRQTFAKWTESGEIVALLVGNYVVATAIPHTPITDGRFELVIKDGANQEALAESLSTLKAIIGMKGSIHIDRAATESVEKDITCHRNFPRECGCVDGACDWKPNEAYHKCLNGEEL